MAAQFSFLVFAQCFIQLGAVQTAASCKAIYEQVQDPNERELAPLRNMPCGLLEELESSLWLEITGFAGSTHFRRFYFEPSLNIEGFGSGHQGQLNGLQMPRPRFEVRLVPGLETD